MFNYKYRGKDTHGRQFAFFKRKQLFPFAFLHTKFFHKGVYAKNERIPSKEHFCLSFQGKPLLTRESQRFLTELPPLKVYPFPLQFDFQHYCKDMSMYYLRTFTNSKYPVNVSRNSVRWQHLQVTITGTTDQMKR